MDKSLKNRDSGKNQRFSESFVHWKYVNRYSKMKVRKKFGPKADKTQNIAFIQKCTKMQLHERVVRPCLEPKTYGRKPGSKVMP